MLNDLKSKVDNDFNDSNETWVMVRLGGVFEKDVWKT